MSAVRSDRDGPVAIVTLDRPAVRNAVDGPTAAELAGAFRRFEADPGLRVAVLTGGSGTFCAGADLKAVADGRGNQVAMEGDGPMGPTRMLLSKPVIAAVEGFAVAGGLELALWCDLRVAAEDAVFGVYCRRWGVPLIDGGTLRLPRLVGHGVALDLILTGRAVGAAEALAIGLVNRKVARGKALEAATALALEIAAFPQACLRNDRRSAFSQWALPEAEALAREFALGLDTLASGEAVRGASSFSLGEGRHGDFSAIIRSPKAPRRARRAKSKTR